MEKEDIRTELVQLSPPVQVGQARGLRRPPPAKAAWDAAAHLLRPPGRPLRTGKMLASDGILLGSPTYVADVSPEIKALIGATPSTPSTISSSSAR